MSTTSAVAQPTSKGTAALRSLRLVAQMVAGAYGLKVRYGRTNTAQTNGKEIELTGLAAAGTDDDIVLLEGLIDHEAAHCRLTDFSVERNEGLEKALTNIFEDIRIELSIGCTFPGSRRNLDRTCEALVSRGIFTGPKPGMPPASMICGALVTGLRATVLEQDCMSGLAEAYRPLIEQMLGETLWKEVWLRSLDTKKLQSTLEARDLARAVIEILKSAQPSPEEQGAGSGDQGSDQDEQHDGDSDADETGDEADGAGDQGSHDAESDPSDQAGGDADEAADGEAGQTSGGSDAAGGDAGSEATERASGDGNNQADAERDLNGKDGQDPESASEAQSDEAPNNGAPEAGQGSNSDTGADQSSGKSSSNSSHKSSGKPSNDQKRDSGAAGGDQEQPVAADPQALQEALDAVEVEDQGLESLIRSLMEEEGQLDDSRSAVISGTGYNPDAACVNRGIEDPETIRRYRENCRPIATVLGNKLAQLIEASRDMEIWRSQRGRKLQPGFVTSILGGDYKLYRRREEHEAVNTAVLMFRDYSGSMNAKLTDGLTAQDAACTADMAIAEVLHRMDVPFMNVGFAENVCVLKRFEEPISKMRTPDDATGNTHTDLALYHALGDLIARDEQRKLVIIETDGLPGNAQATLALISEARRIGVESVVIYIGQNVDPIFRKGLEEITQAFSTATCRDDIAKAVFEAIKRSILH